MPTSSEVTFKIIIDNVRQMLSDTGTRISETPEPFNNAWWGVRKDSSSHLVSHFTRLMSEYGVSSGPKEICDIFYAEVKAIQECLDKLGHEPAFAKWQMTEDSNAFKMYNSLNQRAVACSIWEKIAFPIRLHGEVVVRIVAPRDVFGSPIIEAMPIDQFVRGVSTQTANDQQEFVRLRKHLYWWRLGGGTAAFIILAIIVHRILVAINWLD